MPLQRLVVASASDDPDTRDRAFASARRRLAVGDEVVLVGPSSPEGIARTAVHEDARLVVVAGTDADVAAVRDALIALDADDVDVESDDAGCDEPDGSDRRHRDYSRNGSDN